MSDSSLRCDACGTRYPDRWRCECGHPLEYAAPPLPDAPVPSPAAFDFRDGLWSFASFLPEEPRVTLGEGATPLVEASDWDAEFKLEYVSPTGSFKDRGATVCVSRAVSRGAETVIEDSSGNAGAAIATYAARAGLDARIYVPASVKEGKLRSIRRAGADPIRVDGSREEVTAAAIDAVESGQGWYASHAWRPSFLAGTATFAYEVALQRDWTPPDALVIPLGHGTLFLGAWRGFRALRDAGWIDRVPRLLGVQAAGYDPIARELHGSPPVSTRNEIADGIQIRDPVRKDEILKAIEATDGDAIALDAPTLETELERLHQAGFYTEPTCAIAPAALRAYRERGSLVPADDVVVPLTGSGLKT